MKRNSLQSPISENSNSGCSLAKTKPGTPPPVPRSATFIPDVVSQKSSKTKASLKCFSSRYIEVSGMT